MDKNESGLGIIELAVVCAAVVLISMGGLLVYRRHSLDNNKPSLVTAPAISQSSEQSVTDGITAQYSGRRISSGQKAYNVTIPNGWAVIRESQSDFIADENGSVNYDIYGVPRIVEGVGALTSYDKFHIEVVDSSTNGPGSKDYFDPTTYLVTTYDTTYLSGTLNIFEWKQDLPSADTQNKPKKGDKAYYWVFDMPNRSKKLFVSYHYRVGDVKDEIELIKKVIGSIKTN